MRQGFPVAIAELLVTGGRPLPAEAAAIVVEVCARVVPGPRKAVTAPISASSVFVEADGSVSVAGGLVVEDEQTVSLLGHLLLEMLRTHGPEARRPAARLEALAIRAAAVSEAAGPSLARFVAEVRRFAPEDPAGAVKGLFDRWRGRGALRVEEDGRVPETIRRLLPEADLAAMAGLTPTLHGSSARSGFFRAGRRLVLTAGTVALLGAAGATYYLWGDGEVPNPPPAGASAAQVHRPSARELLPSGGALAPDGAAPPGAPNAPDAAGREQRPRRAPAPPD
jgi:hypothetical protein